MKYFITILTLFFSISLFSQDNMSLNEKITRTMENKIKSVIKEETNLNYINEMLNFLDNKENYSIEQKKVIKILSLLNFEAMTFYNNEEELLRISKSIFRPSICGAYFFKNDFLRALNETNQFFIKNENDMNNLKSAFNKMENLFLIEAQKKLSQSNVDFETLCKVKKT